MGAWLAGLAMISIMDSVAGRGKCEKTSSDRGLGVAVEEWTSEGVWGSDSVGVGILELGTEAGILIWGGRNEIDIALAWIGLIWNPRVPKILTWASGRRGSSSTTLVFLILCPSIPKYLVDSKDQCKEPTIQSANPCT